MNGASNTSPIPDRSTFIANGAKPAPVPRPSAQAMAAMDQRLAAQSNAAPGLQGVVAKPSSSADPANQRAFQIFERAVNPHLKMKSGYTNAPPEGKSIPGYNSLPAERSNYDKLPPPTFQVHVKDGVVNETYSKIPFIKQYGALPPEVNQLKDEISNAGSEFNKSNKNPGTLQAFANQISSFQNTAKALPKNDYKAAQKEIVKLRKQFFKALTSHVKAALAGNPSRERARAEFQSAKNMFFIAGLHDVGNFITRSGLINTIEKLRKMSE